MSAGERFFDTNVLLYLLSGDAAKADRAEELISGGGVISVQVLNEFAAVASRKLGMAWPEIREILAQLRAVCHIVPIDLETHEVGLHLAERRQLPFYDALTSRPRCAPAARCSTRRTFRTGSRSRSS